MFTIFHTQQRRHLASIPYVQIHDLVPRSPVQKVSLGKGSLRYCWKGTAERVSARHCVVTVVTNEAELLIIFIPVTSRVKGYTRFVGKYVTGRRKRFRLHRAYIFLIRITSRVDPPMSVCPSVRMNAEIS